MPESQTIQFGCPHCRRRIKVTATAAGRSFACPSPDCRKQLVVPTSTELVPVARRAGSYQVFVSYSSKDKQWADAVCAALEEMNIDCWIAPRDIVPGTEWGASIIGGIDACKVMVLVFSTHANDSPQVRREVERAINKGLVIVPLRVENVIPSGAMEYALSNTHWLDALTPPTNEKMRELALATKDVLQGVKPPRVTTKLAPMRTSSAPQPAVTSRARWLLLLPIAGFLMLIACGGVAFLGWQIFSSGVTDTPNDKQTSKQKNSAKSSDPQEIIENFRKTYDDKKPLPVGWRNEANAFAVAKDPKNGKTCLRIIEKGGEHTVELPALKLTNQFFIEMEFLIHWYTQTLTIELDSRKGGKKLRTVIQPLTGSVAVGDKLPETPPNFKVAGSNVIRIARNGNVVTVEINGVQLSLAQFNELADFDIVRIGLIAGDSANFGPGSWARIYSVKVGTLPP